MEISVLAHSEIKKLKSILDILSDRSLFGEEITFLKEVLSKICPTDLESFKEYELSSFLVMPSATNQLITNILKWQKLFDNIPGYDYVSSWLIEDMHDIALKDKTVITVCFAPSYSYNISHLDGYYLHLKEDNSALFWFPTFEDARNYPKLFNFKGTWKEAYLLLIETLKKGWPMEEFPEELKPFLKK